MFSIASSHGFRRKKSGGGTGSIAAITRRSAGLPQGVVRCEQRDPRHRRRLTPEEAFAGARRAFGSWGPSASRPEKLADLPPPTRRPRRDRPAGAVRPRFESETRHSRKHPCSRRSIGSRILGGRQSSAPGLRSERSGATARRRSERLSRITSDIAAALIRDPSRPGNAAPARRRIWRLQRERVSHELGAQASERRFR